LLRIIYVLQLKKAMQEVPQNYKMTASIEDRTIEKSSHDTMVVA